MSIPRVLACTAMLTLMLGGCGQTGPLVYPGEQNNTATSDNPSPTE